MPNIRGYRVLRRLGQGGMGTVWEAIAKKGRRGLREGDRVAIKILHEHLAEDPNSVRSFKREAGIGMAIRHPNLARVYELGTLKGSFGTRQFLVMSYLEGRTLREVLTRPLPERFVRRIGAQMASALNALHERDLIHRDLKPENIFVDDEEHVTIVDYGLSVLLHRRESSMAEDAFAGTIAYSAPERLQSGQRIGKRSDLYALGVILYEMATGQHPFPRDDLADLIHAILQQHPRRPSRHRPSLSYFLDRVILTLLDKAPEGRLESAAQAERVLTLGEASRWWRRFVQTTPADVAAGKRALAVDRPTRICGRDEEMRELIDLAQYPFRRSKGRAVMIMGEAGIGKSRLIDALSEEMEHGGFEGFFLVGRPASVDHPLPFEALNSLIERAFALAGLEPDRKVTSLLHRLRDLLSLPRGEAHNIATFLLGESEGEWSLQRAVDVYTSVFRAMSRRAPGVLVFESLHRAGEGSLAVINALVRRIEEFPILLVGTAREEEARTRDNQEFSTLLQNLEKGESGACFRLGRLKREDVEVMLADLSVEDGLRAPLAERLIDKGGGHPEYVIQVVRMLESDGQLARASVDGPEVLDLPGSPLDLAYRRLFKLTVDERRFLEASSIQGIRFRPEATAYVLGLNALEGIELLGRLEEEHGLVQTTDLGARFSGSVAWRLVHETIDPEVRSSYHRRLSRYLLTLAPETGASGRLALEIAIHAQAGGDVVLLSQVVEAAARFSISTHDLGRALDLLDGAYGDIEDGHSLAPVSGLLLLATVLDRLGERELEAQVLAAALRGALEREDRQAQGRVHLAMGRFHAATGRFLSAIRAIQAAETELFEDFDPDGQVEVLTSKSAIFLQLGDDETSRDAAHRALEIAKALDDERPMAQALFETGRLLIATSDLLQSDEVLKEAKDHAVRAGDLHLQGEIALHHARVHRDMASYAEAMRLARQAWKTSLTVTDRLLEARSRYLVGEVLLRAERIEAARRQLEETIPLAEEVKDPFLLVYLLADLGVIYQWPAYEKRDLARAVECARGAVRRAQELGLDRERSLGHAVLASAYLAQGRTRWAEAISRKGVRERERDLQPWHRTAEIYWVRYRILKRCGREEEARDVLRRARDVCVERIGRQDDERVRGRMRKRHPVHRWILEAWDSQRFPSGV